MIASGLVRYGTSIRMAPLLLNWNRFCVNVPDAMPHWRVRLHIITFPSSPGASAMSQKGATSDGATGAARAEGAPRVKSVGAALGTCSCRVVAGTGTQPLQTARTRDTVACDTMSAECGVRCRAPAAMSFLARTVHFADFSSSATVRQISRVYYVEYEPAPARLITTRESPSPPRRAQKRGRNFRGQREGYRWIWCAFKWKST